MQLSIPAFTTARPNWLYDVVCSRLTLSVELLTLLASCFFITCCNGAFWSALMSGRDIYAPFTWFFAVAIAVGLIALHFAFLLLVLNRWTVKPLLTVLFVAAGMATYFTQHYQVYFDTTMVRNVLRTNPKEARDLLTLGLLPHMLLHTGIPLWVLWRVNLTCSRLAKAGLMRMVWIVAALAVAAAAILLVFQDLSATMRNQKALRHLITPGNLIVSTLKVVAAEEAKPRGPKISVGIDAKLGDSWQTRTKPVVVVLVVGETARSADWGLSGYGRQTTPELAKLGVHNFRDVTSCGTNTEVSVPCMFSPFGRRHYDEAKILGHESLLHVLRHAKLNVLWRDNQSGCKGVCSDIVLEQLDSQTDPTLCDSKGCLDEIMLKGLEQRIASTPGSLVIVLHQLGNHGPAYFRRYPPAMRMFTPTCDTVELGKCSREQVINSYDNAIRYTDHFLAQTIRLLQNQQSHDAAMVYVSDHGESLGENCVFLHGLPRVIAPEVQTHVPMVIWTSSTYERSFGVRAGCLQQQADRSLSHDNFFHTVLGMLDVRTQVYDRAYDITADCHS